MDESGTSDGSLQPLDSRQLLAFITLAKAGSFTTAARMLFLSPSAISHSLKALEGEIGHRLFHRIGKKVSLTPAGENLHHYAEKILNDMGKARKSLEHLAKWGKGRLRIGAADSICQFFIPSVLSSFHRDFSDWPVSVATVDTRQCVEAIRQQRIDIGIAIAPNQAEALDVVPLFTDELMWIVSPQHPWALNDGVSRDDIAKQRLIFNIVTSHTFRLVEKYFESDKLRLKLAVEVDNFEAVKEMVRTDQGITAMATWMVGKELAEGTLVALPLGKRKLTRNWCVLRPRGSKTGMAEESFLKFCHQAAVFLGMSPKSQSDKWQIAHALSLMLVPMLDWIQPVGEMAGSLISS